jgi:hypothetical protein
MARGGKAHDTIVRSPVARAPLEHWQRSTTIQAGLATRGQILLLRADGRPYGDGSTPGWGAAPHPPMAQALAQSAPGQAI